MGTKWGNAHGRRWSLRHLSVQYTASVYILNCVGCTVIETGELPCSYN